jgi:hypothetical protein
MMRKVNCLEYYEIIGLNNVISLISGGVQERAQAFSF